MATVSEGTRNPRVGMLPIVRKRRAVISEVRPFQGQDGMVHLVRLEYKDEQSPESEELIWELEPACRLLEPTELPRFLDEPMPGEDFDALVRAARWGAIQPYLDPDGEGPLERMPISAPFHGAVQVEDYQLVPLLKALSMPRIHLMIADDVELLDPVRFTRTDELKPAERERVQQVVVRRLKREINARTQPPRFCVRRPPQAILLVFTPAEERLINAFNAFRSQVRGLIASQAKKRRLAGSFAIEILGKRLLSGAVTFAESWRRCKRGLREDDPADDRELLAAQQSLEEEAADDRETEQRQATASTVIGAWMKAFVGELDAPIAALDSALEQLGLDLDGPPLPNQDPRQDARYTALTQLIDRLLREADQWKPDERLVVFTEYKTTLDYLLRRLRADFPSQAERFLYLFGGMDDAQREQIKQRFNDPAAAVRVLVATDAASEGLNLQSTARYVLHFDCPWNPSRLEQRNGRLDRHGQARDVHVFHFASDQDADLRFIAYLITKVDQIREDLGATGELFDEATHRCLIEGDDVQAVQNELDARLETARGGAAVEADARVRPFEELQVTEHLNALARELDLDPDSQHATLDAAMSMRAGRPQLSEPESRGRCRILHPELDGWSETIDATQPTRKQKHNADRICSLPPTITHFSLIEPSQRY